MKLQCCVSELQKWFSANHLNEGKTEFIPFVPKPYNHIVDKLTICIGDDVIRASFSVTDLGVVLDRHLKMSHQVSKMMQTCTYKLRLINVIRNKLTVTVAERVIIAMVTGNLDYCNSLLNAITANEIGRIQKVQNTAARLILNRDRRSSATVMLNDLHWLSVKKRVMYKILLLVYKSLHGTTPDYITMRLNECHPTRTLRSCEYASGKKDKSALRRYNIFSVCRKIVEFNTIKFEMCAKC